jgi:hypothetical protein
LSYDELLFNKNVFLVFLAHIEGVSTSRSPLSLISSLEDIRLAELTNAGSQQSSIDDEERTSGLPTTDDTTNNKCPIEILMLIFYGG